MDHLHVGQMTRSHARVGQMTRNHAGVGQITRDHVGVGQMTRNHAAVAQMHAEFSEIITNNTAIMTRPKMSKKKIAGTLSPCIINVRQKKHPKLSTRRAALISTQKSN